MIVVLDANVVVSSYLSGGPPAEVMRRWESRAFEVVASSAILAEYDRVLRYTHLRRIHRLDDPAIETDIRRLRKSAILVEPTQRLAVVQDETDNRFLECAVEGDADLIVSGDRHLLNVGTYQGIRVLTPAAFVALLDSVSRES